MLTNITKTIIEIETKLLSDTIVTFAVKMSTAKPDVKLQLYSTKCLKCLDKDRIRYDRD